MFAVWWLTAFCQYWKTLRVTMSAAMIASGAMSVEKPACPVMTR